MGSGSRSTLKVHQGNLCASDAWTQSCACTMPAAVHTPPPAWCSTSCTGNISWLASEATGCPCRCSSRHMLTLGSPPALARQPAAGSHDASGLQSSNHPWCPDPHLTSQLTPQTRMPHLCLHPLSIAPLARYLPRLAGYQTRSTPW